MMPAKPCSKHMEFVLPFIAGAIAAAWPSLAGSIIALGLLAVSLAASSMAPASLAPRPARRRASSQPTDWISRL